MVRRPEASRKKTKKKNKKRKKNNKKTGNIAASVLRSRSTIRLGRRTRQKIIYDTKFGWSAPQSFVATDRIIRLILIVDRGR